MAAARAFAPLQVEENADGWGPVSLPGELQDIPYAPFSKTDRLGRSADWNPPPMARRVADTYRERMYNTGVANTTFTFQQEEDDAAFRLVDNRPKSRVPGFGGRPQQGGRTQRGGRGGGSQGRFGNQGSSSYRSQQQRGGRQGGRQAQRGGRGRYQSWRDFDKPARVREASVDIRPDFRLLEEIEFSRLSKLNYEPDEPVDLKLCGSLEYYDKTYDRVTVKTEKPLQSSFRTYHITTTSEDPEIRRFADENAGRVFVTDTLLAVLMVCPRSVFPWDIVVTRQGDKVFLDKRPSSQIDYVTVNETALDGQTDDKDNINSPENLALEATLINKNFVQQVLKQEERMQLPNPNPFGDGNDVASVGYRYRKWSLGDYDIVVRCEIDGVMKQGDANAFLTIRALNEFDSKVTGVDWRQKLDTQRGAVLATELKNNSNKLARWTAEAILAGTEQIKIGYVSRANSRNNAKHVILGTQFYKPAEFAAHSINLNMAHGWGIVKVLCDMFLKLEEGKYILTKDPNKAIIRLHAVPADAFIERAGGDDEEGSDNEGDK